MYISAKHTEAFVSPFSILGLARLRQKKTNTWLGFRLKMSLTVFVSSNMAGSLMEEVSFKISRDVTQMLKRSLELPLL